MSDRRDSRGSMTACAEMIPARSYAPELARHLSSSGSKRAGSSSRDAVDHIDRHVGVHGADIGAEPGETFVRVARAAHIEVGLPVALTRDDRELRHRAHLQRRHEVDYLARRLAPLTLHADQKPRRVDQDDDRDVERVAQHEERVSLSHESGSIAPALKIGLEPESRRYARRCARDR